MLKSVPGSVPPEVRAELLQMIQQFVAEVSLRFAFSSAIANTDIAFLQERRVGANTHHWLASSPKQLLRSRIVSVTAVAVWRLPLTGPHTSSANGILLARPSR